MIWTNLTDNRIVNGFKLPSYRSVNCPAYEANERCKYYGHGYVESGWDGSICFHPRAEGNKTGWLMGCPKRHSLSLQDAPGTAFESRPG